jgi:hypothetical protein
MALANVAPTATTADGVRKSGKKRRTRAEIDALTNAILELLDLNHPMTVRQVFYRLVARMLIAKTELEYNHAVVRLLTNMRLDGRVPFSWIADHTRWMRKPATYTSLEDGLQRLAHAYRRSVWDNQDEYVEVWCEKDALAGVIYEETAPWDVPLMVSKGFSSLTYAHDAAQDIRRLNKPTHIYYFGDHDPSGVLIDRAVERRLREFAPDADITFERVAVLPEQIEEWQLPTRPTKRGAGNTHARDFEGNSVEVDAIEPAQLRLLVRDYIEQHVDRRQYEILKVAEASEREILRKLAAKKRTK